MNTHTTTTSVVLERYYEKVTMASIDKVVRDACIEAANKVADKILSQYQLKNMVVKQMNDDKTNKKKLIIALEVEKSSS